MILSRQTLETALHSLRRSQRWLQNYLDAVEEHGWRFQNPPPTTEEIGELESVTTAIQEIEAALKEDTQP